LASLESLYPPDALEAQRKRYRALEASLRARLASRGEPPAGGEIFFVSAPGRTELCGNHTDHNHGKVLAAAIDLDSVAAVAPREDMLARVASRGFGEFEVDLADLAARSAEAGTSAAIIRGVAAGLAERFGAAGRLRGFDAVVDSEVLPGSGLSSSAAFEVLAGGVLCALSGVQASPAQLAEIGQYAENAYFGKPSGLMDQMASALGSVAAIDFGAPGGCEVELLRFDPADYGLALAIVATGGSHADLTEDYAAIPAEMRAVASLFGRDVMAGVSAAELASKAAEIKRACGDRPFLRAWHFVKETDRPAALAGAIKRGDIGSFLAVVRASGDSSAKYLQNLYSIKAPREQGIPSALALTEDFLAGEGACRVHGGGFAGTIQAYLPIARLESYRSLMESAFGPGSVYPLRIRPFGVVCIDLKKGAIDER
jgi:galactokinase